MLRLILCLIALPVPTMAQVLEADAVSDFWEYVAENEATISSDPNIFLMFNEIERELNKVHGELVFEFSSEAIQPRQFVISADGLRSNFPAVEEMVRAAPRFHNLEIVAFRQPVVGPLPSVLEMGGASLSAEDLSFVYFTDRNHFDLVLIHDDFATARREQAISISILYLDAAVGEFRVANEVGTIDFVPQAAVSMAYKRLPIESLPDELDNFSHTRLP